MLPSGDLQLGVNEVEAIYSHQCTQAWATHLYRLAMQHGYSNHGFKSLVLCMGIKVPHLHEKSNPLMIREIQDRYFKDCDAF